jgi:hypothetical protein
VCSVLCVMLCFGVVCSVPCFALLITYTRSYDRCDDVSRITRAHWHTLLRGYILLQFVVQPACSFCWSSGISSYPAVFFSHNKPANSTFSYNNPAKRTG